MCLASSHFNDILKLEVGGAYNKNVVHSNMMMQCNTKGFSICRTDIQVLSTLLFSSLTQEIQCPEYPPLFSSVNENHLAEVISQPPTGQ